MNNLQDICFNMNEVQILVFHPPQSFPNCHNFCFSGYEQSTCFEIPLAAMNLPSLSLSSEYILTPFTRCLWPCTKKNIQKYISYSIVQQHSFWLTSDSIQSNKFASQISFSYHINIHRKTSLLKFTLTAVFFQLQSTTVYIFAKNKWFSRATTITNKK